MTSVVFHCVRILAIQWSVWQLLNTQTVKDNASELCGDLDRVRFFLEDVCLHPTYNDTSALIDPLDPLDKCRFEFIVAGCVLQELSVYHGVSCNFSDIFQVLRRDEVRKDLLDSIDADYCDARLLDSQCELDFFIKFYNGTAYCFATMSSLYMNAQIYDVDSISSADGEGKLKCSIFVESFRCFVDFNGFNETCPVVDFATALIKAMNIVVHTELLLHSHGEFYPYHFGNSTEKDFDLLECVADIPDEFPTRTCPPTSLVADAIVALCLMNGGYYQCEAYLYLDYCVSEFLRYLFSPSCPNDYTYFLSSVEEHVEHLAAAMDMFHLQTGCKDYPYIGCYDVNDCWIPDTYCRNYSCVCAKPGYYLDYFAYECVYFDCQTLAGGNLTLIDQIIYDDERCVIATSFRVSLQECFEGCTEEPACRAARYDHFFTRCFFLRCYDLSKSYYYGGVDSFIIGCQDDEVDNVTPVDIVIGVVDNVVDCYPNGTMTFPNPFPAIYINAMAVQNEGSHQAFRCSTTLLGSDVIITGCDADTEITVVFSTRGHSEDGILGGRTFHAYSIRCNTIAESGIIRIVEDLLAPQLEITTVAGVTPFFVITSAIRSQSVTGEIVSSATVGQILYWTIDIPQEYTGRPTCFAYSGTSASGSPSAQLVTDGCPTDRDLVADTFNVYLPSIGLSKRIWTVLFAFRFYNSDDVFFKCTVKVCPSASTSCDLDCGSKKRRATDQNPEEKERYFTTSHRLHILSSSSDCAAFAYGVWFATVCFTFLSL